MLTGSAALESRTMPTHPPLNDVDLLAQVGWVRALARQLALDVNDADDLAQEALVVALKSGRPATSTLRPWLAGILRGVWRTRRRTERRRSHREDAVRTSEAWPSAADLVERASSQRKLVDAVLSLEEPYRGTMLQRYFEELSNEEIAQRADISASTVATRLLRGREMVRARLQAEGGPTAWFTVVFPLARWKSRHAPALPAATTGALLVTTGTKLLIATTLILAAMAVYQFRTSEPRSMAESGTEASLPTNGTKAEPPSQTKDSTSLSRTPVQNAPLEGGLAPRQAPDDPPLNAPSSETALGRVVDLAVRPIPSVNVIRVNASEALNLRSTQAVGEALLSGADGTFEFEPTGGELLVAKSDIYATVLAGVPRPEGTAVVVAPRMPVAGIVVDEVGLPVANADLWSFADHSAFAALGALSETSVPISPHAKSDALGRFEFDGVGKLPSSYLMVSAIGFPKKRHSLPPNGDANARIVLRRGPFGPTDIRGRVLLASGQPASGAWVAAGAIATRADARGEFHVEAMGLGVDGESPITLIAASKGAGARTLRLPPLSKRSQWPEDIVLILDQTPLEIHGSVIDETGAPVNGARVRIVDPTPFGLVSAPDRVQSYSRRTVEDLVGGGAFQDVVSPHSGAMSGKADGSFVLRGLIAREYRLEAFLKNGMLVATSGAIPAGTQDVVLVLDKSQRTRIAGRLVDTKGQGISGVTVSAARDLSVNEERSGFDIGFSSTTDDDGAFALEGVAPNNIFLRLTGESIVPELDRPLPDVADLEQLVLVVGRRCHVIFDWGDWSGRAQKARFFDRHGRQLVPMELRGNSIGPRDVVYIGGAPSEVLAVPDTATTAVLYSSDEEELGRRAIQLTVGEIQTVEL